MFLDINRTIADNVNEEMRRKGMKQLELASYLGYSKQTVSRMLKGERTISASELKGIASFLSVPVNIFLSVPSSPVPADISLAFDVSGKPEDTKRVISFLDTLSSFMLFNRRAVRSGADGGEAAV